MVSISNHLQPDTTRVLRSSVQDRPPTAIEACCVPLNVVLLARVVVVVSALPLVCRLITRLVQLCVIVPDSGYGFAALGS